MPKKDKGVGVQKKIPTKSEVKEVNKRLYKLAEESANYENIKKTADLVYSNENEIVNNSTFKSDIKPVSPSGRIVELDNELQFPMV